MLLFRFYYIYYENSMRVKCETWLVPKCDSCGTSNTNIDDLVFTISFCWQSNNFIGFSNITSISWNWCSLCFEIWSRYNSITRDSRAWKMFGISDAPLSSFISIISVYLKHCSLEPLASKRNINSSRIEQSNVPSKLFLRSICTSIQQLFEISKLQESVLLHNFLFQYNYYW